MKRSWIGVREPAAEGFGARFDGQVPMRVSGASPRVARPEATKRAWWMPVVRIVRNAFVAVLAMAVIPIATVAVRGDYLTRMLDRSNSSIRERTMVFAEPARAFGVARDPAITPMQAGLALNALQYHRSESRDFVVIKPAVRDVRPWRVHKLSADMFVGARTSMYDGPASTTILESSVKGFSPREQAYLKELAEAPVWREFDLVARAPAVDIVGGQLRVPFGPGALPEERPLPSYRDSKEMAYAAVSRAAYYMSIGKPREAEQVLRSIISFGFAYIDNGTTTMDDLIGTVDVGIGRDALRRFYAIEHDPRASLPELTKVPGGPFQYARQTEVAGLSADEVRRQLLAQLADPALPRPERSEAVRALTLMSCTSTRELLFGPRTEVRKAIEQARNSFARYPSERAVMDLQAKLPSASTLSAATGPMQSLLVSPAMVAGAVLHNPRMGLCTLLLTAGP